MANRYALLIGNTQYDDARIPSLAAPEADVKALAEVLRAPEIGGFEVNTLLNFSFVDARRAISRFYATGQIDDLLLFYFSGHGLKDLADAQSSLCLALRDTEAESPQTLGIESSWLKKAINSSAARQKVQVLDCCHSAAIEPGIKGEFLGQEVLNNDTLGERGRAQVTLTSCDKLQFSYEGNRLISGLQTSLFTHFICEGLRTGAAANEQGQVTHVSLFNYVRGQMLLRTQQQTPRLLGYYEGEIMLAHNPNPVTSLPGLPSSQQALATYVKHVIERVESSFGRITELEGRISGRTTELAALERMLSRREEMLEALEAIRRSANPATASALPSREQQEQDLAELAARRLVVIKDISSMNEELAKAQESYQEFRSSVTVDNNT